MKVNDLPAGRQLDALVAEKVMGWLNCDFTGRGIAPKPGPVASDWHKVKRIPEFSTDIKATREVISKMAQLADDQFSFFVLEVEAGCNAGGMWDYGSLILQILMNITPGIICRAALKAVGVTEVPD